MQDFVFADYKLFVLYGAVSSGKTVASALAWIAALEILPKYLPIVMVGKTERTLQANVLDPIEEALGPKHYQENIGRGYVWIHGHKVRIYGANDEKAESKIRGKTIFMLYGDEATLWPESFFNMAIRGLRLKGSRAIFTMNPGPPQHWFYKSVIKRAEDPKIRAKALKFLMSDNPYLPQDYPGWISAMYVPGTVWYKRLILGDWAAAEGAVFPFFDSDPTAGYILQTLPQDLSRFTVSADYGQVHPTVYGLFAYSESLKAWILIKEEYATNKTNEQLSAIFGSLLTWADKPILPEAVDIDPGGGGVSLRQQLRVDYPDLDIRSAIKVDVARELQELSSALYTHKLLIYHPCQRVIGELANYVWDDKARDRGKDEPLDKDCDGVDTLRYGWQRIRRL